VKTVREAIRGFYGMADLPPAAGPLEACALAERLASAGASIVQLRQKGADAARLLTGKMTSEAFLERVRAEYPGFKKIAQHYVLMSYVLTRDREKTALFLRSEGEALEKTASKQPLVKKELERAKAFIL